MILERWLAAAFLALAACTLARPVGRDATDQERRSEAPEAAPPPIAAILTGPAVRLVGRFDQSDPAGPRFAWSGSSIATRLSGTALDVRLRDAGTNELQVTVDGTPTSVLVTAPARDHYAVASGLPDGVHDIVLTKRTEARLGELQFLGFIPGPGSRLLPVPVAGPHRIEFIGDSITAGYGNEGTTATCPFSPTTENEYATYAAIASRALGAEHVSIAWSGKTVEQMTELYERTLPEKADSRWDFHAWVPEVVVINLGTNDFAGRDPGAGAFTAAYDALLERVRIHYADAYVFCLLGPMLADTYPPHAQNLTHARAYITAAVEAARQKGDSRVAFLEFPAQEPATAGCGFHPNLATHRQMADMLVTTVRAKLGLGW